MDFRELLLVAPVLLFSMVAHEFAHGYAALKQGDPTAHDLGRLTFNPVKHIDPFMTIILPVMTALGGGFIFGGAKPVPVDPRNYRHVRRGDIIVSLAGVATNLVLAVLCALLVVPLGMLAEAAPGLTPSLAILQAMVRVGVKFNLILTFFNLLPIPPLDGSHVAKYLLPPALGRRYAELGRFGFLIVLLFLTVGRRWLAAWMTPVGVLEDVATSFARPYLLPSPL